MAEAGGTGPPPVAGPPVAGPPVAGPPVAGPSVAERPPGTRLKADCSRCAGLCCVATAFARSAEFALDKPAGVPCLHLADAPGDFGCTIHDELRPRGFAGCTTYDCFGAGQHVVQTTYAGVTWRDSPGVAAEMFRVFHVVRALHELLWLLERAARVAEATSIREEVAAASAAVTRLTVAPAETLDELDVDATRASVVPLLRRTSDLARAGLGGRDLSGADLVGRNLATMSSLSLPDQDGPLATRAGRRVGRRHAGSLRGASLRGALLVGADLRGADLDRADLTGADLRSADVRGADLRDALFLSQQQVDTARGDSTTLLPDHLDRPAHWPERTRA